MFKFLKEKISNWTKKISEKASEKQEEIEKIKEKPEKKSKKETLEKKQKETTKKITIQEKTKKEEEIKQKKDFEEEKEIKEEALEPIENEGFFKKLVSKVQKIKVSEEDFQKYSEELELLLLENNVALEVSEKIIRNLKEKIVGKELLKKEIESEIRDSLRDIIEEILIEPFDIVDRIIKKNIDTKEPYIILFCGINGTGKTTTIAKIANILNKSKISCVIAAGDTFRAASIEQIKNHGEKLGIKVISNEYGSDPASVGFDAIQYAKKHSVDCVLIDTAGRMHTSINLLKEIEKISRVCKPDSKIFVGESITGNDVLEQVKGFDSVIGIDGIILTKADIDEKGGTALSVGYVTRKPILYLGIGQDYNSIEQFNKRKFVEKLGF